MIKLEEYTGSIFEIPQDYDPSNTGSIFERRQNYDPGTTHML
jgi:hypothetical protein